jgi:hypothetical protein
MRAGAAARTSPSVLRRHSGMNRRSEDDRRRVAATHAAEKTGSAPARDPRHPRRVREEPRALRYWRGSGSCLRLRFPSRSPGRASLHASGTRGAESSHTRRAEDGIRSRSGPPPSAEGARRAARPPLLAGFRLVPATEIPLAAAWSRLSSRVAPATSLGRRLPRLLSPRPTAPRHLLGIRHLQSSDANFGRLRTRHPRPLT